MIHNLICFDAASKPKDKQNRDKQKDTGQAETRLMFCVLKEQFDILVKMLT